MRIAVFGGSFDPPHIAHEKIVFEALEKLNIDKLFIVPTYLNPFKSDFHLSPKKRVNLLKKLFLNEPKVYICDYEVNQKRKVASYETIMYLKRNFELSKIYLIIGSDNFKNLDKWYKIEQLKDEVEFVLAKRVGFLNENLDNIKTLNIDIDISSTNLRENINLKYIPKKIDSEIKKLFKTKYKRVDNLNQRIEKIKNILDEKKAENIEVVDLRQKEYIVDYVVIATTLNSKHAFSLLNHLKTELKPQGEEFLRVDDDDEWTIVDLGDIFIHLMSETHRQKYNLEEFLEELGENKE
ncbi:fused nicotinate-mononucleotide adenylyltransferase / ribosomal silencing factor [Malaciobacter halophilus]|nr:nicotinate (nicotinamide) nucleotide adenylyltransferase [Malaciobacter halophilus]AXH08660.1 fused nicotinate-mononucleotide adenylyltransferase / ribosomal silencing factor [Malaciobacter halophilus]